MSFDAVRPLADGLELTAEDSRSKVGLIAHYSRSNYGNHLVNLALRKVLVNCGNEVDLIVFTGGSARRRLASLLRFPFKLLRLVRDGLILDRITGQVSRRLTRVQREDLCGDVRPRRLAEFDAFAQEHLEPNFTKVGSRKLLARKYDRFLIGSDQIWNYDYDLGPWHFADFAPIGTKVAMAPSVGHEGIPLEWRRFFKRRLSDFDVVGTRELLWTESLPDWASRPNFVELIDPTLVVSKREWENLAASSEARVDGVLVYELGGLSQSQRSFVSEIGSSQGLGAFVLSEREAGDQWATNAADFLSMIASASCVVTDSYHGAIFAFMFDRPLVLIERDGFASSMNSRIDTLVRNLRLEDRLMSALRPQDVLVHDYSAGRAALQGLRAEFMEYMRLHGLVPESEAGRSVL